MTDNVQFTDEQLTAYLDGEAAVELCALIDAALETDAALGERLASLDIPVTMIARAYDALLDQAPTMPELPIEQAPAKVERIGFWGGIGVFGTGIAAGLAMAIFTELGTPAPKEPGWKAVVASYQSLYSMDTLADDGTSAKDPVVQLAYVSKVLGADITQLPQVAGLTFKRAQILGFKGKPLVQIAFARADGTPVALCIIKANNTDRKSITSEELLGMASASWNVDGLAYLLIGGDIASATKTEAQTFETWAATISDI